MRQFTELIEEPKTKVFLKPQQWSEMNHPQTGAHLSSVSAPHQALCSLNTSAPEPSLHFRARKSTEALFMFKVISAPAAAVARHFWLCNLASALTFALIWQMPKRTICFAPSCFVCVWAVAVDTGAPKMHCIDDRLCCHGDTWRLDVTVCVCTLLLCLFEIFLESKWTPIDTSNSIDLCGPETLTQRYPSRPDDTAEPRVSFSVCWVWIPAKKKAGGSGSQPAGAKQWESPWEFSFIV